MNRILGPILLIHKEQENPHSEYLYIVNKDLQQTPAPFPDLVCVDDTTFRNLRKLEILKLQIVLNWDGFREINEVLVEEGFAPFDLNSIEEEYFIAELTRLLRHARIHYEDLETLVGVEVASQFRFEMPNGIRTYEGEERNLLHPSIIGRLDDEATQRVY